ncbi:NAD(+) synthase (glutamine-hydrolyzing) [Ascochyta rabiei]|uniref:Glutamine-dependent NAD(+) synthetase n=1 Tax=Didymella rabiei TaxID=5454 RepID=A0A163EAU5_DIDRA|nr:NAD(+) synthase (glutamine-hydrolyzing) [Ascochyta rabiei]KZM23607.1 ATP binding [Ascochyta rabiei]UPX12898.1 NAD(+) synthase (glutamine-hydrolyzing) [Ascochyta rabiei]
MSQQVIVASCSLNQWALDWEGNLARIKASIQEAKARRASVRVGSELEICGYGCLDHFLEDDIYTNSWHMLLEILGDETCNEVLLDIGMPVKHGKQRLNCRIIALNGKIILIRPKLWLANEGNYNETRYFHAWSTPSYLEEYHLPPQVAAALGYRTVPLGDAIVSTRDAAMYSEDLLTPGSQHYELVQNGVDIFTVSAAFQQSVGKTSALLQHMQQLVKESGGIIIYSNQKGCDGDRFYYGGKATVMVNGTIAAQGLQFTLNDVEVVTARVDLNQVRCYRQDVGRLGGTPSKGPAYERIKVDFSLSRSNAGANDSGRHVTRQPLRTHSPEEELVLGPACWLWDMLRRSKAAGFLCPLSGGIDSCSTATLVYGMCRVVMAAVQEANEQVAADLKRIIRYPQTEDGWLPSTPEELCNCILHTMYMGVTAHSSAETRSRAQRLADNIGAYHFDMSIDGLFEAQKKLLGQFTNYEPKFSIYGGSKAENLALHNIQARGRMVTAYYFAQMLPTIRKRQGGGALLVLGSVNLEECLRGNVTKHDCSSADLSATGGMSKLDIRRLIRWAQTSFSLPVLGEFLDAPPTGELEPRRSHRVESDEKDMGMTYEEIFTMAKLRKEERMGPVAMFERMLIEWRDEKSPEETAVLVKRFHHFYAINRHKMTTMTPAYHTAEYSAEDPRPFLYPEFQSSLDCKRIDLMVYDIEGKREMRKGLALRP